MESNAEPFPIEISEEKNSTFEAEKRPAEKSPESEIKKKTRRLNIDEPNVEGGEMNYLPEGDEPKCTESTKSDQLPNDRKFSELISVEEKLEYVNTHRGDIPALLFAAKVGDDAVCRCLLDLNSYKSELDSNRASVVHYAAMNTDYGVNVLDFLHRQGVDLSVRDKSGCDALSYALRVGNIENASLLINLLRYEESLLEHCICTRGVDSAKLVFEALIAKGFVGQFDANLLYKAASHADLPMLQWLVQIGQVINDRDLLYNVLLHSAKNATHFNEIANFLISNFQIWECRTFLARALKTENCTVASKLMKQGVTLVGSKEEKLAFMHLCVKEDSLLLAKFVEGMGQPMVQFDESLLLLAFEFASVEMCQWLNFKTATKMTMAEFLHRAVLNEAHGLEIIQHFIGQLDQQEAYKDLREEHALHLALKSGKLDIVKVLLEHNKSLIHEKCGGHNLLLFCVSANQLESAKFVFELDKSQASGENGKTALNIARNNSNEEMCQWLEMEFYFVAVFIIGGCAVAFFLLENYPGSMYVTVSSKRTPRYENMKKLT
ncbi:Hypothetical predicted protein [Cloeon dipterum]|uniref:Ion transport domain-containing protein n=1 Tax=Cloeon dipterum TaxID=197152 RepID=A0A8S1DIF9_9INSE|nr:Hypothetical predicted protein [Cloeon dipterum]